MTEQFIFTDKDQIEQWVKISANSKIEDYHPAIRLVQQKWLKPIIGKAMLDSLIEKAPTDDFTDGERSFLHALRFPAAILTQYHSIGSGNITLTEGGFTVPKSDHVAPASQFRINQYKDELERNAQAALSSLLEWLSENGSDHSLYWDSEERKSNMARFIRTANEFNSKTSLDVDHFIFRNLSYLISRTEETVIQSCLCQELYDHMKTELEAGNDLGDYSDLLGPIAEVIVPYVLADAINEMGISIQGAQIMMKFRESSTEETNGVKEVSETTIQRIRKKNQELAGLAVNRLKEKLNNADPGTYPIYEASECASASIIPEITPFTHDSSSGIML